MHTVELLEQALSVGRKLGYEVRHEWLGGAGGGCCEYGGRKVLFVDLALNTVEQLDQVTSALRQDPAVHLAEMCPQLRHVMGIRRSA